MASVNKEDFERMYLVEKLSIPDIAAKTGLAKSTARLRLIAFGIKLRSRVEAIALAAHKLGKHRLGKSIVFSDTWKANLRASILKSDRVLNAVGKTLKPSGYIEYTTGPNKWRLEHIVLMERHIGRQLMADEVVHHKDHNPSNNAIENLQLMTRSEHSRHHAIINHSQRKRNKHGQFK